MACFNNKVFDENTYGYIIIIIQDDDRSLNFISIDIILMGFIDWHASFVNNQFIGRVKSWYYVMVGYSIEIEYLGGISDSDCHYQEVYLKIFVRDNVFIDYNLLLPICINHIIFFLVYCHFADIY